jgi:hypothetical protein
MAADLVALGCVLCQTLLDSAEVERLSAWSSER